MSTMTAFFCLFVALLAGSRGIFDPSVLNVMKYFDRSITLNKAVNFKTNGVAEVLDANFSRILNFSNLYTAVSHKTLVQEPALAFLSTWWGINTSEGIFNPVRGSWSFPWGSLIPFINGDKYYTRLSFDSWDLSAGLTRKWIAIETGYLMSVNGTRTIPAGAVLAGQVVNAGEILYYTRYSFLHLSFKNQWNVVNDLWRQDFELRGEQSARSITKVISNQTVTDQAVVGVMVDRRGKRGLYLDYVFSNVDPFTGNYSQTTTSQAMWPLAKMYYPDPIDE